MRTSKSVPEVPMNMDRIQERVRRGSWQVQSSCFDCRTSPDDGRLLDANTRLANAVEQQGKDSKVCARCWHPGVHAAPSSEAVGPRASGTGHLTSRASLRMFDLADIWTLNRERLSACFGKRPYPLSAVRPLSGRPLDFHRIRIGFRQCSARRLSRALERGRSLRTRPAWSRIDRTTRH